MCLHCAPPSAAAVHESVCGAIYVLCTCTITALAGGATTSLGDIGLPVHTHAHLWVVGSVGVGGGVDGGC